MIFRRNLIWLPVGTALMLAAAGCGATAGVGAGGIFPAVSPSAGPSPVNYTIVLAQFPQLDSYGLAQQLKERAKALYGVGDVWLENFQEWILVNYGHYSEQTGSNAIQQELMRVRQLYPQLALGPYQFCYLRELPQPDPPAPTQWYLLNNRCYYSLEIATYYNTPEQDYYNRKEDAVTAVKNLREKGEMAYFVHGRLQSRVYVGCFTQTAVQETWQGNIQIRGLSPELNELKQKYTYHENGMKIYDIRRNQSGREIRIARPSQIVKVESLVRSIPF